VVIDTTGSFDVVRLHQAIIIRLRGDGWTDAVNEEAEKALQRVRITRVFDFFGVIEAVNEIREVLEQRFRISKLSPKSARRNARHRLGYVPDSEDEDEDEAMQAEVPVQEPQNSNHLHIGLVLIDNISTVVNPLMKGNHIHGMLRPLCLYCNAYQYSSFCFAFVHAITYTIGERPAYHSYPHQLSNKYKNCLNICNKARRFANFREYAVAY